VPVRTPRGARRLRVRVGEGEERADGHARVRLSIPRRPEASERPPRATPQVLARVEPEGERRPGALETLPSVDVGVVVARLLEAPSEEPEHAGVAPRLGGLEDVPE